MNAAKHAGILGLIIVVAGCVTTATTQKSTTSLAEDVYWKILNHYSKEYVCSDLSDGQYFGLIWNQIEADIITIAKRKGESGTQILLYRTDLEKVLLENRSKHRKKYDCDQ